jgi:hypothetical protein
VIVGRFEHELPVFRLHKSCRAAAAALRAIVAYCRSGTAELPGTLSAELEENRRSDGDQEHAGLRGVVRVHHQESVRHPAGRLGSDDRHGPPDYTARCHSKQIPVKDGAGSNYVQYQNAEVDRLLELGVTQSTQDPPASETMASPQRRNLSRVGTNACVGVENTKAHHS